MKRYRAENRDNIAKQIKRYQVKNRDNIVRQKRLYQNYHRKNNIQFKIGANLRTRLSVAFKRNSKSGSAVRDLGCSISELKQYLESLFQEGMSWDNYGIMGWHIDHITPLSSFNLSNREELLKACNYTNLQPLWAKDNLKKGNKHEIGC